jgi:hypothetical protein
VIVGLGIVDEDQLAEQNQVLQRVEYANCGLSVQHQNLSLLTVPTAWKTSTTAEVGV